MPPSSRDAGFDLAAAHSVQAELTRLRRASGWTTVGRKVGYANRALWRTFKLDTLIWAPMYDRTVRYAPAGAATARQSSAEPLAAGELVSTGTLTGSHPLSPGEQWGVEIEGLDLPALTLQVG